MFYGTGFWKLRVLLLVAVPSPKMENELTRRGSSMEITDQLGWVS
jgi:hypothetical protein